MSNGPFVFVYACKIGPDVFVICMMPICACNSRRRDVRDTCVIVQLRASLPPLRTFNVRDYIRFNEVNMTNCVTEIALRIPTSQLECASWITEQPPDVVAAVLSLGEAAYLSVQRESASDVASERRKHWEESTSLLSKIGTLEESLCKATRESEEALVAARRDAEVSNSRAQKEESESCRQRYEANLTALQEEHDRKYENKTVEANSARGKLVQLQEELHLKTLYFDTRTQEIQFETEKTCETRKQKELDKQYAKIQQQNAAHDVDLQELTSSYHKRIDSKEKVHKDEVKEFEAQLCALRSELDGWYGKEAKIRLDEAERNECAHKHVLSRIEENHKTERERLIRDSENERERLIRDSVDKVAMLKQCMDEQTRTSHRDIEYLKGQAEQLQTTVQNQSESYASSLEKFARPCATVSEVGKAHERLVFNTFAKMRPLGELTDTSGKKAEGYADFDWRHTPAEKGCPINALLEVKATLDIHSIHDKEKFERDVAAGTKSGRINSAIFISLRCRIMNTNRIDFAMSPYGIPIMTVSKAPDDGFESEELIEMCFVTFAQLWPILCKQRRNEGGAEATLLAITNHLNDEMESISKISKEIDTISKAQDSIKNSLSRMTKEKNRMRDKIENLRLNHDSLNVDTLSAPDIEESPPDDGDVDELQRHILEWNMKKGRFPSSFANLSKGVDIEPKFERCFDAALSKAIVVKKRIAEEKKAQTVDKRRKLQAAPNVEGAAEYVVDETAAASEHR
jgi:hypothetical protein